MTEHDLRRELTRALEDHRQMWGDMATVRGYVDAVLPVARAYAAAQLVEAAGAAQDHGTVDEDWAVTADELRTRADNLRAFYGDAR